jgi:hypothetical protein
MPKVSEDADSRKFLPGLGDLIDLMTVTQLRLVRSPSNIAEDTRLHEDLNSDISLILNGLDLDWASLVERVVYISLLNAEIWELKDKMSLSEEGGEDYSANLTLAHQLNGYRNRIRNDLNTLQTKGRTVAIVRSNTDPDGLLRWTP